MTVAIFFFLLTCKSEMIRDNERICWPIPETITMITISIIDDCPMSTRYNCRYIEDWIMNGSRVSSNQFRWDSLNGLNKPPDCSNFCEFE